ncbi:MAG: DUF4330 family protein [Firmicutes bacterium]|nr:DUF4330 family protein [Bacillota bacterium]
MKKFKKLNGLDIFIIVIIVIAVIFGAYKAVNINRNKGTGSEASYIDVEYDACVERVRMKTVDAVNVGDLLYDDTTGVCIGEIINKECYPYMEPEISENGEAVLAQEPNYYVLKITVKSQVIDKEDGYYLNGVVEFKSNSKMETYTKYAQPIFTMLDMRFV